MRTSISESRVRVTMKTFLSGLAAASLALAGTAALAGPAPVAPPASQQQSQTAAAQDWLSRVAIWGQGYDAVTTSRSNNLLWMLDAPTILVDKLDAGNKGGARTWTNAWAAEARQRLAADLQAYQGLSTDVPAFPSDLPMSEENADRLETMSTIPDRTGALLISSGQAGETYIQLVEQAASGRPEDMDRLAAGIYVMMISTTEAENVMMESLRGSRSEPNYHWRTAMIEVNKALVAWMHHNKAVLFGEPSNAAATARAIRGHAANTRAAADQIDATTDRVSATMDSDPVVQRSELAVVMRRIFASIRQSAEVERRMAAELDTLAEATLEEDEAGTDASLARIETLTDERIAIDAARRQLMAQSPG